MGGLCSRGLSSGKQHDKLTATLAEPSAAGITQEVHGRHIGSVSTSVLDAPITSAENGESEIRDAGTINPTGSGRDDAPVPTVEAFLDACRSGYAEIVQRMLRDAYVNPAANDNAALRCAAANGHARVVELLLSDERVDPTAAEHDALSFAAQNGHAAVVEVLLGDERVFPGARSCAAILYAARNGHVAVVQMLARDGRTRPGWASQTAFGAALEYGQAAVVDMLLQEETCCARTYCENLFIEMAVEDGHADVVDALLRDYRVVISLLDFPDTLAYVLTLRHMDHILEGARTATWRRRMDAVRGRTSSWRELLME
jgi:hypothetical protein